MAKRTKKSAKKRFFEPTLDEKGQVVEMITDLPHVESVDDIPLDSRSRRSDRKKELHTWLRLAQELTSLKEKQILALPLDEELHEELVFITKMKAKGAKCRQIKHAAKLLQDCEDAPETALAKVNKSLSVNGIQIHL